MGLRGGMVLVFALAVTACGGGDKKPEDISTKTWVEKLSDRKDGPTAFRVLAERKDRAAIPALLEMWPTYNYPLEPAELMVHIAMEADGGPYLADLKPLFEQGLGRFLEDDNDRRTIDVARMLLTAALDANQFDFVDEAQLISIAKLRMPANAPGQVVRIAAIKLLGRASTSDASRDVLIAILQTPRDPRFGPSVIHDLTETAAVDSLAHNRTQPSVDALLLALYERPELGDVIRPALVEAGPLAEDALLAVARRENRAVNEAAVNLRLDQQCEKVHGPKTRCLAPSRIDYETARALGAMQSKKAVPYLVSLLKQTPLPRGYDESGGPLESQHAAAIDALAAIGGPDAAKALENYAAKPGDPVQIPRVQRAVSRLTRNP